jgi:hypothetical protein
MKIHIILFYVYHFLVLQSMVVPINIVVTILTILLLVLILVQVKECSDIG